MIIFSYYLKAKYIYISYMQVVGGLKQPKKTYINIRSIPVETFNYIFTI